MRTNDEPVKPLALSALPAAGLSVLSLGLISDCPSIEMERDLTKGNRVELVFMLEKGTYTSDKKEGEALCVE